MLRTAFPITTNLFNSNITSINKIHSIPLLKIYPPIKYPIYSFTYINRQLSRYFYVNNTNLTNKFSNKNRTIIDVPIIHEEKNTVYYPTKSQETEIPNKADDVIKSDKGLQTFLQKVIRTTGAALTVTCSYAYLSSILLPISELPLWFTAGTYILAAAGSFASVWKIQKNDYEKIIKYKNGHEFHSIINSQQRKNAFGGFVICNAVMLVPVMSMVVNPFTIPTAIMLSTGTMLLASKFALTKINGQLLTWQGPLISGLIGMIGMLVTGLLSHIAIGPNLFSEIVFSVQPYIGIGVFSALTSYNVHNAIDKYQNKDADHIGISVDFFLTFINLFRSYMNIIDRK